MSAARLIGCCCCCNQGASPFYDMDTCHYFQHLYSGRKIAISSVVSASTAVQQPLHRRSKDLTMQVRPTLNISNRLSRVVSRENSVAAAAAATVADG
jgi:hypothetical protein